MIITAILWSSHAGAFLKGAENLDGVELRMFTSKELSVNGELTDRAISDAENSDAVLIYRSSDAFWDKVEARFKGRTDKKIISLGHDPSYWALSTVSPEILGGCLEYMRMGGAENAAAMLCYIAREICGENRHVPPPRRYPWQGIYHPSAPEKSYESLESYMEWYGGYSSAAGISGFPAVGVLFNRHYWVNDTLQVENTLIKALEDCGMRVIPVFSSGTGDPETGALGGGPSCERFYIKDGVPVIDALIKLQAFFLASVKGGGPSDIKAAENGAGILSRLNVPVFQPVVSSHKTLKEWESDPVGLSSDIPWSIAMPEFEGVIEPFFIGGAVRGDGAGTEGREPHIERCARLAGRVKARTALRFKKNCDKKVVFMLHNSPCSSVEATVGAGAGLDCPESVVRLMRLMEKNGYSVKNIPENGDALAGMILEKKAISEFRWTTVGEIVSKGGDLARIDKDTYAGWWDKLPPSVKNRMREAWGDPPGTAVNGMPPAMVYDGKIIVTGLDFGGVIVCVQPKRGCAGARCDGEVCKILHDPDVPPPHQYLATYRWIENVYKADMVIHVGTHGTLEFLPGKGTGLSEECIPDIVLGDLPHLYIYNADNSPEGVIAKRRSYATLVNHMQAPLIQGGLYGDYEELDRFLGEWEKAADTDPGRAHMLEHLIAGLLDKMKISDELGAGDTGSVPFRQLKDRLHGMLGRIRNTWIQDGMHIFGGLPDESREAEFIYCVLRYDGEDGAASPRRAAAEEMGLDLGLILRGGGVCENGEKILEAVERRALAMVRACLGAEGDVFPESLRERVFDLRNRLRASEEDISLIKAMDGGYTPPGPSGLIYRGRHDVLPTGRNMYSIDPGSVPTKAAAVIGNKLAEALVEKYLNDEGRLPENVAVYWMCADLMWSDGEGMAQILSLLGTRPVWSENGRVNDFEIIPLSVLGRPRIDVTIRVSGITRDNFPDRIALLDRAVQAVSALNEPPELNFVRKHSLINLEAEGADANDRAAFAKASRRIFSAAPGTYRAGINLAVYASAWKENADLADIFVAWNGFAYGDGYFGEKSHAELARSLSTVDVTFNKVMDDAHDLLGCCGYFGSHGGLSVASSHIKGEKVANYYGDTRERGAVEVRTLADEIRRVARSKLLNPKWVEGMKRHGYKGAGDISKRVGRLYGWEASTGDVDDKIFDDVAREFIQKDENREFFEKYNPWALEEIARRLLEAEKRGLWEADPELLDTLKETYLDIESWLEERTGDIPDDFQGGSVDIIGIDQVKGWGESMASVRKTVAEIASGRKG